VFELLFKYPLEDFRSGAVQLAADMHWTLVLLAVAAAAARARLVYHCKSTASLPRAARATLWALRAAVLALLMVLLFHLVLQLPMPQTSNVFIAVLVDDSRSMQIEDAGAQGAKTPKAERKSRLTVARELLGGAAAAKDDQADGLLDELAEICPVKLFRFSGQADSIKGLRYVTGMGNRTNLFTALSAVVGDLRSVPVVGVARSTRRSSSLHVTANALPSP